MYFKHWQRLKVLDLVSSTPNQAFFAYQILYFTDSNVTTIKQWLQRPASLLIHFEVYFFQTFLADVFITLWGLSYQWRWAQCLHSLCGITICHYSFYIIFLKMVILLTGYYLHFEHSFYTVFTKHRVRVRVRFWREGWRTSYTSQG